MFIAMISLASAMGLIFLTLLVAIAWLFIVAIRRNVLPELLIGIGRSSHSVVRKIEDSRKEPFKQNDSLYAFNPATGLPMIVRAPYGYDAGGNTYGFNNSCWDLDGR